MKGWTFPPFEEMHPWPLLRPASAGRLFLALLLDGCLLLGFSGVALLLTTAILLHLSGNAGHKEWFLSAPWYSLGGGLLWLLTTFLVWWGYYPLLRAACGQTLGERIAGVRLVSMDGSPPKLWQVLGRGVGALPSLMLAGAGYLWALTSVQRRSWHSILSRTRMAENWPS
jgi:uncharacterized RDD family membrane protein YckC